MLAFFVLRLTKKSKKTEREFKFMKIINVRCSHCGVEGYNPNVPKGHVIDTCSCSSCKQDGIVIGFKDGNTQNNRINNLYHVAAEVHTTPIMDSSTLTENEIEFNNLIAIAKFYNSQKDYEALGKVLETKEIAGTPEANYFNSKIYFQKLKNTSKGVKLLKQAAEGDYAPAMAEYGYIIALGLYNTLVKLQEGLDYLYRASQQKEPISGAYLADIYKEGLYKGTDFDDLTPKEWFDLISVGEITHDAMVHIVLGTFYYNGFVCKIDTDLAVKHFRMAADQEYVLGMYYLIKVLFENYLSPNNIEVKDEIMKNAEFYLHYSSDKNCNAYMEIKAIYEALQ